MSTAAAAAAASSRQRERARTHPLTPATTNPLSPPLSPPPLPDLIRPPQDALKQEDTGKPNRRRHFSVSRLDRHCAIHSRHRLAYHRRFRLPRSHHFLPPLHFGSTYFPYRFDQYKCCIFTVMPPLAPYTKTWLDEALGPGSRVARSARAHTHHTHTQIHARRCCGSQSVILLTQYSMDSTPCVLIISSYQMHLLLRIIDHESTSSAQKKSTEYAIRYNCNHYDPCMDCNDAFTHLHKYVTVT